MPSEKVLEQKKVVVTDLADKFNRAASGVLVKYQGIKVEDDTAMRAELRAAGVDYSVIKNTLISRACDMSGLSDMKSCLDGMNAIAVSYEDPIAPAKILKKYADKVETFEIRSGFLDGSVVDASVINQLAAIPPKEVLVGKLLGSLQSSLYSFAYALQAVVDKKTAEGDSAAAEKPAESVPTADASAE